MQGFNLLAHHHRRAGGVLHDVRVGNDGSEQVHEERGGWVVALEAAAFQECTTFSRFPEDGPASVFLFCFNLLFHFEQDHQLLEP